MSNSPLPGPLSPAVSADALAVDPNKANIARMYDYFLGGKDNLAADREAAEDVLAENPNVRDTVRANRQLLGRTVCFLVEQGIRQFIDLGSGLPTQENVHEVAQATAPDARVIYVDNDPVVLSHGRALLETNPHTVVIGEDLRNPQKILRHPDVCTLIDFTKPTAVLAFAILHFLPDAHAYGLADAMKGAFCAGSYLAISHVLDTDAAQRGRAIYNKRKANAEVIPRSHAEIRRFFDGLELIHPALDASPSSEPDLVHLSQWKQIETGVEWEDRLTLCGVARKTET
ncbi:SAM-dependent methyltransferase [Nonomuraea sp. NPDC049784]|uniref:SAM-dependent methyltransferase n=1 Tax=Nonomuraea sp. NPDC049784 TaxID=3154361 RepID=UPI00340A713E